MFDVRERREEANFEHKGREMTCTEWLLCKRSFTCLISVASWERHTVFILKVRKLRLGKET